MSDGRTAVDITTIIENEIREAREDTLMRLGRGITDRELAAIIVCALDEHRLLPDLQRLLPDPTES